MIRLTQKLVVYINSHEIEEVQSVILDLVKASEYKKAAVLVRNEVGRSEYRRQFTMNESLNASTDSVNEDELNAAPTNLRPPESPRVSFKKT